jgi:iron complex transport system ATP-binding protein
MKNKDAILKAHQLTIGYVLKNQEHILAESLSFELNKGEMISVLGPNGVGKSTLIKTILGEILPLQGTIIIDNKHLKSYRNNELSQKIAVVLTDKIRMANLTVRQLVELGRVPHTNWLGTLSDEDLHQIDYALASTQIEYIQDQPLHQISDGQLQKTMIARALAQNGDILILDEPAAHLDLISRFEIMELLQKISKEKNKAVLVVTHDLENAIATSDKIWIMQCHHELVQGTPEDLILNGKINLLFGNHPMQIDIVSGKIKNPSFEIPLKIEGTEQHLKWVKQALNKNPKITTELSGYLIRIEDEPFRIHLSQGSNQLQFYSIEELLNHFQ